MNLLNQLKQDKYLKKLLIITFIIKISAVFIIITAFYLFPFCTSCHDHNFLYPPGEKITLASAFKTWDSQHYLYLAQSWYSPDKISNAFYPLFPLVVRIFKIFFLQNTLASGLFLSNLFSLVAIIFFYLLVKKLFGPKIAYLSALFFLAFPMAFYFNLPYAESLFMMLAMLFFYCLYQKKFIPAFLAAFFLPLTRAQGILLVVPLIVFLVDRNRQAKKIQQTQEYFLLLSLGTGFITYLLIMYFSTHSFLEGFTTYQYFRGHYTILTMLNPLNWFLRNFVFTNLALHGFTTSMIDRSFFILFLIILVRGWRLVDKILLSYTLSLGLLPALADNFMAYTRYLLVVFPVFIILALKFKKEYSLILSLMFGLQIIFLVMHSLNYWVA